MVFSLLFMIVRCDPLSEGPGVADLDLAPPVLLGVRTLDRRFIEISFSEPVHVGGLADAPTPLEYLLSGAMGCFAAVFAFYAAKWDVSYDTFEASAKAELDVRGHMMEDAPPSGFRRITVQVDIGVSETPDQEALERVMQASMRGCPGI